jgi:hydroxypyruvate isomerase
VTGPVDTGSSYRLAVSAEMVFLGLPFEDRVRRIADAGFEVEIWDWTKKDIAALAVVTRHVVDSRRGSLIT